MQTIEHIKKTAADLYWLAFLLTGQRDLSADVTIDILDSEHGGDPSSLDWVPGLWKSRVIVKALAAISDELAASIRRANSTERHESGPLPQDWILPRDTSKAELELALWPSIFFQGVLYCYPSSSRCR